VNVLPGSEVSEGNVLLILEAMTMETEVRAARGGVVQDIHVKEGDAVTVGAPLLSLA
jgi:oxaloacetate decarboxylase alpha subunit